MCLCVLLCFAGVVCWSENAAKESKIHPQITISTSIVISSFDKEINEKLNELMINIENLIQRDGKIEIIAEKSLSLSTLSQSYKKNAIKVK